MSEPVPQGIFDGLNNHTMAAVVGRFKTEKYSNGSGTVVLVPQPSDDPDDPLNWSIKKKITIFASVCLAAFAAQMSPNCNILTVLKQISTYHTTPKGMLNTVAASLAGWVAGPFLFIPIVGVVGRSCVIFWSLVFIFIGQVWGAKMTGPDDYIAFTMSRLFTGLFGGIPAILGSGYIIDMFYLHQRGKAFAVFEVSVIFAVIGGGTLGGLVDEGQPWSDVFWWTLGPVGSAIVLVFTLVEETSYNRDLASSTRRLPKPWLANRLATFIPGWGPQLSRKGREFMRLAIAPFQITFTPITLLMGTYIFVALGLPIMQASTLAAFLEPPVAEGGYGFRPIHLAYFTMTAWAGIIFAQAYGYYFNDRIPIWVARRRGGTWHPEYRLANAILPSILLPVGLGLWGIGLQYHLHFMVLALSSFLIWFAALLALPVCYNYVVECFLHHSIETSVSLNAYRVSFGLISVFITTQWRSAVGVGWMWGMGAFLVVLVDMIMAGLLLKGHVVREWSVRVNRSIAVTDDGAQISLSQMTVETELYR